MSEALNLAITKLRGTMMARPNNLQQFRLGQQFSELRRYMKQQTVMTKTLKSESKKSIQDLVISLPEHATYDYVKSRLMIPSDMEQLKQMFADGLTLGFLAWTAAGILYVEWHDRTPKEEQNSVDDEILQRCPSVDVGFLRALDAIGRNRIRYQFFTSRNALYERVIMLQPTSETQDSILKAKGFLVPRKISKNGKTEIVVELEDDRDKITPWQARLILPDKKLIQDKPKLLKAAKAALKVKDIKSARWGFSDDKLVTGGAAFEVDSVENMVLDFYRNLNNYKALQRIIVKLDALLDAQKAAATKAQK